MSKGYYVKGTRRESSKKHSKHNPFRWLLISFALTAVGLFSATAGAILAISLYDTPLKKALLTAKEEAVFNQEETVTVDTLQLPKLQRPVNILVLGTKVLTSDLDTPPEEDLGYHALVNSFDGLSDTMLLLRLDPVKETLTVLSIPRDTKTYIEGQGVTKINAANYYGGPALSAQAISNLLGGVPIDRYIRVNVQGVEKLIDAIGGVTVYVPYDMKYTDESQHLYINLKKGEQHLNGEKAVQFLRFRYDRYGDIGRVQRQQLLMRAIVEKALNPKILLQTPQILSIVQSHIDTNLSVDELVAIGSFATQTPRSDIQMIMLPGEFSGDGKYEISYWLPDEKRIPPMMAEYFEVGLADNSQTDPADLRVAIQDSTDDPEAVSSMIDYLQEAGYQRVYVSDRWNEKLQTTKIVAQKGDDGSAAAIRAILGVGEVLVESTGAIESDVTIQLGEDWLEKIKN